MFQTNIVFHFTNSFLNRKVIFSVLIGKVETLVPALVDSFNSFVQRFGSISVLEISLKHEVPALIIIYLKSFIQKIFLDVSGHILAHLSSFEENYLENAIATSYLLH